MSNNTNKLVAIGAAGLANSATTTGNLTGFSSTTNCGSSTFPYYSGSLVGYGNQPSTANIEIRVMENGFLLNCGGKQFIAADLKELNSVIKNYYDGYKKKDKK